MSGFLLSLLAFIFAIVILVAVHEFGHYWVAKKCGVKVLRFSIGFGKVLAKRMVGETEFVLSAIPLGGYVKMLDAREAEVPAQEQHREFTSQPLLSRVLIVAAGPVFNFIFAIAAYWLLFVSGVTGLAAVVGEVRPDSLAAQSQFQAGDTIVAVNNQKVQLWSEFVEEMVKQAAYGEAVQVQVAGAVTQNLTVDTTGFLASPQTWLQALGIQPKRPEFPAVIAKVIAKKPAAQAGMQSGDVIVAAAGSKVNTWQEFVAVVQTKAGQLIPITVRRGELETILQVTPQAVTENGKTVGKIGVGVALPEIPEDYLQTVHYGGFAAVSKAVAKTWEISALTVVMIGKMLTGEVAVKDSVGGPISIAKFAGDSFFAGFSQFLGFLALISISLGVLNLLPIPVLDGGHLLLYLIEFVKGSPLSETVEVALQKIGMLLLFGLMFFAVYNDLTKLL